MIKILTIYCIIAIIYEAIAMIISWRKTKKSGTSGTFKFIFKAVTQTKQIKAQMFNPLFWIFLFIFMVAVLCVIFPVDLLMAIRDLFNKKSVPQPEQDIWNEGGPLTHEGPPKLVTNKSGLDNTTFNPIEFVKTIDAEFIPQPSIIIELRNTTNEALRARFLNAREVDEKIHPLLPDGIEVSIEVVNQTAEKALRCSYPYDKFLASMFGEDPDECIIDALLYHKGDTNKDILFGYTYPDKEAEQYSINIDNYKSSMCNPANGSNDPIWIYCFNFEKMNYKLNINSYFEFGMHPGETIIIELVKRI